jgi:hypothetical protein
MEQTDEELLRGIGSAALRLRHVGHPSAAPEAITRADDWGHAVALNWEIQVRSLWHAAWDHFAVATEILVRQASPSVLAQVRLLVETEALIQWLVGRDDRRQYRAFNLALGEIRGMKRSLERWGSPGPDLDQPPLEEQRAMMTEGSGVSPTQEPSPGEWSVSLAP